MLVEDNNIKFLGDEIHCKLDIYPPFVMIDSFEVNLIEKAATSTLRLHQDAWYFKSHLPGERVFPASLLTESMLQTMVLLLYSLFGHGQERSFITNISIKIRKKVEPGMEVLNECELVSEKRGIYKLKAVAKTLEGNVAEGVFDYASPRFMPTPVTQTKYDND